MQCDAMPTAGSAATHQIGAALLRGQFEAAARMVLRGREGEKPEIRHARDLFLVKGDVQVGWRRAGGGGGVGGQGGWRGRCRQLQCLFRGKESVLRLGVELILIGLGQGAGRGGALWPRCCHWGMLGFLSWTIEVQQLPSQGAYSCCCCCC
jgi:hypothetical protein